jgi:hypothetical protein
MEEGRAMGRKELEALGKLEEIALMDKKSPPKIKSISPEKLLKFDIEHKPVSSIKSTMNYVRMEVKFL